MNRFIQGLIFLLMALSASATLHAQNTANDQIANDDPVQNIKLAEKAGQKPDRIIELANLALTKLSKTDNKDLEARAYKLIGNAYYSQGHFNSAIESYKQSAQLYEQLKDSIKQISVIDNIGICYQLKNQYSLSLEYLHKALSLSDKVNENELKPFILNNLGIVYQLTNRLDQSLDYLSRALSLFEETNNKTCISSSQNNLGITYNLLGKYDDALIWFKKAIKTKKEIKDSLNLANTFESVGLLYEKIENLNKAIEYYSESLRLQKLLNNKTGIAEDYTSLARIYLKTKDYQSAYDYLTLSGNIARIIENDLIIKENKRLLSEYYLATGDPFQSRELMSQYAMDVEKLFNKQVSDKMAEITVEFETEQKDYQNKLLQANLEIKKYKLQQSQNIQTFLTTLILLIIGILIYMLFSFRRLSRKNQQIKYINNKLNQLNTDLEERIELRTRELSEALKRAEESDRLKSAFLANMSHEIRTPMNGILGFTKILENDTIPASDRKIYVDVINRQGRSLLQIINDIISLSKIETGQMEIKNTVCNVNKIFDDLLLMFNSPGYLNKKKEVELKAIKPFDDSECNIITDSGRVEQILVNLIDNALKFTTTGKVEFGYSKDQKSVIKLFVRDTGIGIPKDQQLKIFDRFYRLNQGDKPSYSGAGLGLSISKKLATLIGGNLYVESEPNVGSTFTLTIPYKPIDINAIPFDLKLIDRSNLFQWSNKVMLVVEDDNVSFQYIEALLLKAKATVIHAKNGEEAVSICQSNHNIDLVLMDIQLPFMSGYETTKQIKSFRKNLPIIAQTANVLNDERKRSLDAGCKHYISKPIDPDELYLIISKCFTEPD